MAVIGNAKQPGVREKGGVETRLVATAVLQLDPLGLQFKIL